MTPSRPVPGYAAVKAYRCPWCSQQVRRGEPHVVAWRDNEVELRRHWHSACWRRHGWPDEPAGDAPDGATPGPRRGWDTEQQ